MTTDGFTQCGRALCAVAILAAAGCSGPYQAPLARRSINNTATADRVEPAASRESDLVVQEMPIRPVGTPSTGTPASRADNVAIGQLRERAINMLAVSAAAPSAEERANAIEALIAMPSRLKPLAAAGLTDPNPGVRAIAAMAVGKTRLTELSPLLQPLLSDPLPQVRANAIYAMMRCDRPVDPTPLAEMLTDPSPQVRAQAAFVMGELGEKSAIGPLREAQRRGLSKAAPGAIRMMELQIAEARAKLGDDDALIDIRTALFPARSEDLEATALAAQIVGQIGDKGSVDRLMFLTAEWDRDRQPMPAEIRLAAAGSLAKLGHRQGSFIAELYKGNPSDVLRAQAALVLGDTGWTDNLATLTPMLDDPSGRVRVAAAAAIAKITGNMPLPNG
jgi:HEAT repeat protein